MLCASRWHRCTSHPGPASMQAHRCHPSFGVRQVPRAVSTWALAADRPTSPAAVVAYARKLFLQTVHGRSDASINLARACMLIALEEEAAMDAELLQGSARGPGPETQALSDGADVARALAERCGAPPRHVRTCALHRHLEHAAACAGRLDSGARPAYAPGRWNAAKEWISIPRSVQDA